MTIRNKKFRKLMNEAGMADIELVKDNGAFWVYSDRLNLYDPCILCYTFNQMTPEEWVEEIKRVISDEYQEKAHIGRR